MKNLRAEGRQLLDADTGELIALCQDGDDAHQIEVCVNESAKIAPAVSELLVAAGLEFARGWTMNDALDEVARQIRLVRRTMQTRQFDHHATTT